MTRNGEYFWYYDQNQYHIGKTNAAGDSIFAFEPNDHTLRGVTWDGNHLWTLNTSGTLKRFSTAGALLDTIPGLLTAGWGLTFDGTYFWAVDTETDKIYQLSLLDHEPPTPPEIICLSHPRDTVWYSDPDPVFQWTASADPTGILGYSYLLNQYNGTIPDNIIDGTETTATYVSVKNGVWYFHCRAADMSGNWSEVDHLKIQIDTTPPSKGTILIAAGADTVNSLIITLSDLSAEDEHSGMGFGATMRFSNDIVSWSEEEPFSTYRTYWDLSQYGGNDLSGMKRVYVSFKDVAGNWSVAFFDEIVYNAPLLIGTDSLSSGTVGFAYAGTLYATGGWPPYQWEMIEGDLPPGLTLDPDGIITGGPESEGNFTFTVRVTDDNMYSTTSVINMSILSDAVMGDVNGDGVVNILDLITIVRYILDLETFTPSQIWAADVETDGMINILDALGIVNTILGMPMATRLPSTGGTTVWIEPLKGDGSYSILLDSPVPVAGVQLSIRLPQGSTLTSPPASQPFTLSCKEEQGVLRVVLYTLTGTPLPANGSQSLLTIDLTDATASIGIESITVADENGEPIPASVKTDKTISPSGYVLHQNYPNPFNPTTDIRYQIPDNRYPTYVSLKVYNLIGQEVRTLVDETTSPGQYTVTWDGRDTSGTRVPSGVYFCKMKTGETTQAIKMILSK